MINHKILNVIGYVLFFLGLSMLFSAAWSYYYAENDLYSILLSSFITSKIGLILIFYSNMIIIRRFPFIKFKFNQKFDLSARDGYILVTLSWILMSIFSALPFYFYSVFLFDSHPFSNYINCFFESISGLTTTGATILNTFQIDTAPKGLLFWRSFTHFIGGIGIIVFSIAILPLLGFGGVQLFRAEVAGPVADKLTPRVQQTAKLLWSIYIGLILSQTIILMIEGLDFYDSLTHSFSTIATGGFSNHSDSIEHFSPIVQYTIIFFMIVAATSFSLHFLAVSKGKIEYFKDKEFRIYIGLIVSFLFVFFIDNYIKNFLITGSFESGFRNSLFTSVTLLTTTGFSTVDYETWGFASQTMIFILFFIGGCAGSTTGGIKLIRTILVFKFLARELKKLIHPKGVFHIRIGEKRVSEEVVSNTVGFYLFYIFIFVIAAIVFAFFGSDIISSLAISASAIGNIGPGLGEIGPSSNWNSLPNIAKLLATFLMLLGRLEIFTVMLLFVGVYSKK